MVAHAFACGGFELSSGHGFGDQIDSWEKGVKETGHELCVLGIQS
jgi:hypothetical protein